jgi:imidazoleglycerol phosphate dehydratase HisB
MNNVLAELLNLKKYTKTKEEEALLDLKIKVSGTVVAQTTTVVSFFTRVAVAFLLHLGFDLRHRQQPDHPITPSKQQHMATNPRHPPKQQPWH